MGPGFTRTLLLARFRRKRLRRFWRLRFFSHQGPDAAFGPRNLAFFSVQFEHGQNLGV